MSRYYQQLDRAGGFDYELHQLPAIGARTFRGPLIDLSSPYLAFIGSAQTFGRFVETPFPRLLSRRLGIPVLNLGVGGAGPRHFLTSEYLELINRAEAAVIQVLSGRSASNSLFDNSESGGMIGRIRGEPSLTRAESLYSRAEIFPTRYHLVQIINETRSDYLATFVQLLRKIVVPKILFWFSTRLPQYEENYQEIPNGVLGAFPQLVNQRMVERLAAFSDDYLQCVSTEGLPQTLWPSDQKIDGAVLNGGVLENRHYPSPAMHLSAANVLENSCHRFTGRPYRTRASDKGPTSFLIVAAERTGTNLLIGMLKDFTDCYAGGELFNAVNIKNDIIPWRDLEDANEADLLALRKSDPIAFWHSLFATSVKRGVPAVGFKLMYSHGLSHRELLEHFVADKAMPVIHLTRRNLLRRLVSERQALATGMWSDLTTAPARSRPKVELTMEDIVESLDRIESQQALYDSMFAEHPMLRLVYEDLARRPVRTAERVVEFLGLNSNAAAPTVKFRKTGQDKLSDAIVDFEPLLAKIRRWITFFED